MTTELTDKEKQEAINKEITIAYDKMYKDFLRIASFNSKQFEDLLPFTISEFLTKKSLDYQYKVVVIDKKLVNYIGRSMSLHLRSSTSCFWTKYRRESYNSRGTYISEVEEAQKYGFDKIVDYDNKAEEISPEECLDAALNKLNFYYKTLVTEYYFNNMTIRDIRNKYGITSNSIRKDIKHGLSLLQEHCKNWVSKSSKLTKSSKL